MYGMVLHDDAKGGWGAVERGLRLSLNTWNQGEGYGGTAAYGKEGD